LVKDSGNMDVVSLKQHCYGGLRWYARVQSKVILRYDERY